MLAYPFSNHLTFINDPGHGWLKIPLNDIAALGIEAQITPYSFIQGQYTYLEEDCDAPCYREALAGKLFDIPRLDHLIVDQNSYNSLKEHGLGFNVS